MNGNRLVARNYLQDQRAGPRVRLNVTTEDKRVWSGSEANVGNGMFQSGRDDFQF